MTESDALNILTIIRDENVARVHRAQNPRIGGDWLRKEDIIHYQDRITALNNAIVYLALIIDGQYVPVADNPRITTNGE